jgi:hypothetical protein
MQRAAAHSNWTARRKSVNDTSDGPSERTAILALTGAPCRTSSATVAVWPLPAAKLSGVEPYCGQRMRRAPIRVSMRLATPPLTLFGQRGSAPRRSSSATTSVQPLADALRRASASSCGGHHHERGRTPHGQLTSSGSQLRRSARASTRRLTSGALPAPRAISHNCVPDS